MADSLQSLLLNYKAMMPAPVLARKAAQKVIEGMFDTTLDSKHLKLTNGVLYCDVSPAMRSEILLKRGVILSAVALEGYGAIIKEIR